MKIVLAVMGKSELSNSQQFLILISVWESILETLMDLYEFLIVITITYTVAVIA